MRLTMRSAMSILAALAVLPQGQVVAQPATRYVWITGHLEDFINTTYSHDAIYRMLDVIDRYDIPAEPGFASLLITSIRENPQAQGLHEMIERMVTEQGFRFQWHTEDVHGPPPTLAEDFYKYYFADEFGNPTSENGFLIYGMDWDTAVQTILDRYTQGLDPYTGYSLPGVSGGPLQFQEYFGILPSSQTTHGLHAAPAEVAMNLIMPGAMRIKTWKRTGPPGPDDYILAHTQMAWYMGTLYLGDGPTDVRVIDYFLSDKQAESQGSAHPCCQVFPWAYFYNNDQRTGMFWRPTPEQAQLPPEYFGTAADRQAYADAFETQVQSWVADPNIEFVTSDTIKARIAPARIGTLTADKVEAAAVYLFLNWDNANRRPPRYVEYATGRFMSLADAFQALAYALEYYGSTGQIPSSVTVEEILAPIGETDLDFPVATVSGQSVVDVAAAMRSLIQSPSPTLQYAGNRVPYSIEFPGGVQMNPAQFLFAMADVYAYLTNFDVLPGSVTVQPQSMATLGREKYLEAWGNPVYPTLLPYWYSELQMWTAKPARWRGLPGDFDFDGDVDSDDYNQFEVCFTGPDGGPVGTECDPGDFDGDGNIDCGDWAEFVVAWTGPPTDPPEFSPCLECGDGNCGVDENSCTCEADCGPPPASEVAGSTCADGLDNDCDSLTDCEDVDCQPCCAGGYCDAGEEPISTIPLHQLIIGQELNNLVKLSNIVVDEGRRRAYLTGSITRHIGVIDVDSMTLIDTLDSQVGGFVFKFLHVNQNTGILYIFTPELQSLYRFDPFGGGLSPPVNAPMTVAVDPTTGRVFASAPPDTVLVYDSDLQQETTITGFVQPRSIAVDGGLLYVLNSVPQPDPDSGVGVYDTSTLMFQQRYSLPVGFAGAPRIIHVDAERIYVYGGGQPNTLAIITKGTGDATLLPIPEYSGQMQTHGDTLYLMTGYPYEPGYMPDADGSYGVIEVRDAATGAKQSEFLSDLETLYHDIDSATGRLLYSSTGRGVAGVVNLSDLSTIEKIDVCTHAAGLAVRPSDGHVYVRDRLGGSVVHRINPTAGTLENTFETGNWPTAMVLDESRGRLYVLSHYEAGIGVYATATDSFEYEIPLGTALPRTDAISVMAMDQTTGTLYVALPELGTLTMVREDGSGAPVTVSISGYDASTANGPGNLHIAVNESLGRLYLLLRNNEILNIYDSASLALVATPSFPGISTGQPPLRLVFSDDAGGRLFVGTSIADPLTGSVVGTLPEGRKVLAISPNGDRVFLSGTLDGTPPHEIIREYDADLLIAGTVWDLGRVEIPHPALGFDFTRGRFYAGSTERGEVDVFALGSEAIPTVSAWGLMILILLLLTAGAIVIRDHSPRATGGYRKF